MIENLTKETFLENIFNYEKNEAWKYEGGKPCIIDFYADRCQPCKMVAPVLEDLAKKYKDSIKIYKIDTEKEQELTGAFGIKSIPSLLFIPMSGAPQMATGVLSKEEFVEAIDTVLLGKESES